MIDIRQAMSLYSKLRSNPAEILADLGVPKDIMNSPQKIIQNLLNQGKISQSQINEAMKMRDNPVFKQFYKS